MVFSSKMRRKRIREGDLVRIRSEKEIRATLDRSNKCKGLEFMQAMWGYCGEAHRVVCELKDIVIDENTVIMGRCRKGVFVLGELYCEGDGG